MSQTDLDALVERQNQLITSIKKVLINFKKDARSRKTEVYYRERLENIQSIATEFRVNDRALILGKLDKNVEYVANDWAEIFNEAYLDAVSEIETARDETYPQTSGSGETSDNSIHHSTTLHHASHAPTRLQKIKIPIFNGKYRDWPAFRDIFCSLIHTNEQVTKVEKFHYLKDSLRDEPAQMIKHLTMTAENYSAAWKLLNDHYENPRELFKDQLNLFSSQPKIVSEDAKAIRTLLNVSRECRQALTGFKIELQHCDPLLVYFMTQKLPSETIGLWETKLGSSTEVPDFEKLQNFLDTRVKTLDAIEENRIHSSGISKATKPKQFETIPNKSKSYHIAKHPNGTASNHEHHSTSKSSMSCCVCKGDHILRKCPTFLAMATSSRRTAIEGRKICANCLAYTHTVDTCHSKFNCRCGERHHSMLHIDATNGIDSNRKLVHVSHTAPNKEREILLSTAIVRVRTNDDAIVELRALIDSGSQASMITTQAAAILGVTKFEVNALISGISEIPADKCRHLVQLDLSSRIDPHFQMNIDALVLPKLTGFLPNRTISATNWSHFKSIQLADPTFCKPSEVDLILGADVFAHIITDGIVRPQDGSPTAQNTRFGWILFGDYKQSVSLPSPRHINTFVTKIQIDKWLSKLWEIEAVPNERLLTREEQWCEDFYNQTVTRNEHGRYVVRLPFLSHLNSNAVIGKSRQIALEQFIQLERKFVRNPKFHADYSQCINEYFSSNQIEPVRSPENDHLISHDGIRKATCCYLTQHAVIKESSTSTRVRVVFNAARKTANGKSLNEILMIGPPLQNDLPSVITNWRMHKVVANADIKQMFRQILVHPEDAQFQRIFWRNNPSEPLAEYTLKTVTFGTACAPYLAIRTIIQLARENAEKYPQIMNILTKCIYVDDVFFGGDTIPQVQRDIEHLNEVLQSAGFDLRKWTSNDEHILQSIPAEFREIQSTLALDKDETIKTLGLYWRPSDDTFCYHLRFELDRNDDKPLTKRIILSTTARLFDPLGFISPVILIAKKILRKVWQADLNWDDPVSISLRNEYFDFVDRLNHLPEIHIPRWLSTMSSDETFELHGFCDASQEAYAAALYLRSSPDNMNFHCHLLASKTKIAPIKVTTIPRLELLGAHLLHQLLKHMSDHLQLPVANVPIYVWSDSEIVLFWLKGDPNRWDIFVSNRVTQILAVTKPEQWRHIPTEKNPADCASRGLAPSELIEHSLWWNGPTFLRNSHEDWPRNKTPRELETTYNALMVRSVFVSPIETEKTNSFDILHRFSRYDRLLRVTALAIRFVTKTISSLPLTVQELNGARDRWIRHIQTVEFASEIRQLRKNETISPKSSLARLNPFFDENQILRVKGRLGKSLLEYSEKFPIILPQKNHFTKILILEYHRLSLHGGTQLLLSLLRKTYWIPNARNTVRFLLLKCVICYRVKPHISTQQMGVLPSYRVQPSRCFESTGIDFAGPIYVRIAKGRGRVTYKGYIAVFVCLSVKAIHLELVGDMTTESFVGALKRFLARRGLCTNIFSDCGTTFVGATKQMQRDEKVWREQINSNVIPVLTGRGIQWRFIPPAAPNFGGLWEAGVKSMKYHLKRACGEQSFIFEEWTTCLAEIEACLNSRPLCPFTADPDDMTALTPGHFLTGDALLTIPEPNRENEKISSLKKWHRLSQIKQNFWRRWSREYLNRLQSRPKWLQPVSNLQLNDMVLIKDDRLPPLQWLLGRITELRPGTDDLVRVVTVRTQNGLFVRPVSKICKLPLDAPTDFTKNASESDMTTQIESN